MNEPSAIATLVIIGLTVLCSFIGFRDPLFRDKYLFSVPEILAGKEYYRLVTSAFLHADWMHLLLNMVTLYLFGGPIELFLGVKQFLLIYFAAIVGGDLLSLWLHRHHEYRAYGASGGVCGLLFSFIVLFPGAGITLFFPLPFSVPGWLYAILYLKAQRDNIGHDAHLGGAIIGLLITAILHPWIVRLQPWLFLAVSGAATVLFVCLALNPMFLPLAGLRPQRSPRPAPPPRPSPRSESRAVDAILDKISRHGIDSLTAEEKALLDRASAKYRRRADSAKSKSDLTI
jgi:membrane associated rhomboid family serine protease